MPKTFEQARAENELVPGSPAAQQTQITGAEVVGAWLTGAIDAGWTFTNLKEWVKLDADWMSKSVYDANGDGRADNAEQLADGTNTVTAAQARSHIDDTTIHFVINDTATTTTVAWSGNKINSEISGLSSSKENALGNPASDGQQLVSTAAGVRSWEDEKIVPTGGTEGQIIVKQSSTEQDAIWEDIPIAFASSWTFSSITTEGDPGSENFRLNAATQAATTEIYISYINVNGLSLGDLIKEIQAQQRFTINEQGDANRAALYRVSGAITDNTTWAKIPVTFEEQAALEFRNGRTCVFQFYGFTGGPPDDAPDDQSRTYFREGTTPGWTKNLKGYGEVVQTTAATSVGETLAVDDGNMISSNLTGNYTLTALTAGLTSMSATWILQHNSNTVSFPASFKFPGGTPPSNGSGNAWLLGLFTTDTGTTWIVNYVENYTL